MAGKLPGFITGASAKIKLDGKTLAYATDVSYNVDTLTVPVECMGRYEVLSNEPIAYGCNGTFSVIRYTDQAKIASIDGAAASGNSATNIGGTTATVGNHMNPAVMLSSKTFDVEIFQKIKTTGGADVKSIFKINDCRVVRRGASVNKRGVLVDMYSFVGILAGDTDVTADQVVGTSGETDLS